MRGDDLYFGPAHQGSIDMPPIRFQGSEVTIQIPEEVKRLPESGLKASFHASGQFHVKTGKLMSDHPVWWPKKSELISPFRVAALVSKTALHYPAYKRSLTRGGAGAVVIRLAEAEENLRHYFEFFISPPGEFNRPPLMILTQEEVIDRPICNSLSDRFVLVVRHLTFAAAMPIHTWYPDIQIWFFAQEIRPDQAPEE